MTNTVNLKCVITDLHSKGGRAVRLDTCEEVYIIRSLAKLMGALGIQERDHITLGVRANQNEENWRVPWVAFTMEDKVAHPVAPVVQIAPQPAPQPEPQPTAIAEQFCGILEAKQQEMVLEKDDTKWGSCSREKVEQALRDLHGFGSTTEIMEELGLRATANVRSHLESMYRSGDVLKISVTRYGKAAGRTYWAEDYRAIDEALLYDK
jgi:hypothetical protein